MMGTLQIWSHESTSRYIARLPILNDLHHTHGDYLIHLIQRGIKVEVFVQLV